MFPCLYIFNSFVCHFFANRELYNCVINSFVKCEESVPFSTKLELEKIVSFLKTSQPVCDYPLHNPRDAKVYSGSSNLPSFLVFYCGMLINITWTLNLYLSRLY